MSIFQLINHQGRPVRIFVYGIAVLAVGIVLHLIRGSVIPLPFWLSAGISCGGLIAIFVAVWMMASEESDEREAVIDPVMTRTSLPPQRRGRGENFGRRC